MFDLIGGDDDSRLSRSVKNIPHAFLGFHSLKILKPLVFVHAEWRRRPFTHPRRVLQGLYYTFEAVAF